MPLASPQTALRAGSSASGSAGSDGTATRITARAAVCAETARRLACDAGIISVILGSHGEPLDIGRLTRTT
ncbi:MAG: hypothetical protein ACM30G_00840 [Micromonosporaceae bacterium]